MDDNPDHRKLFRKLLETAGYPVVEGSSAKEALAAAEKTSFALMILDLSMPDMDGFEVLQTVRSKQPGLKTIAVSGFMHGRMLESAKLLGAVATLDKDLATDSLLPWSVTSSKIQIESISKIRALGIVQEDDSLLR